MNDIDDTLSDTTIKFLKDIFYGEGKNSFPKGVKIPYNDEQRYCNISIILFRKHRTWKLFLRDLRIFLWKVRWYRKFIKKVQVNFD